MNRSKSLLYVHFTLKLKLSKKDYDCIGYIYIENGNLNDDVEKTKWLLYKVYVHQYDKTEQKNVVLSNETKKEIKEWIKNNPNKVSTL